MGFKFIKDHGEDSDEMIGAVYQNINKHQLLHEEINKKQVYFLRAAVFRMGKSRNAYELT